MEQCMIYTLSRDYTVRMFPLPPMTLPQSLLPENAVFKGVGAVDGQDCYLYAVKDSKTGEILPDKGLMEALVAVTRRDKPQEFTIEKNKNGWTLTTDDLKESLF